MIQFGPVNFFSWGNHTLENGSFSFICLYKDQKFAETEALDNDAKPADYCDLLEALLLSLCHHFTLLLLT